MRYNTFDLIIYALFGALLFTIVFITSPLIEALTFSGASVLMLFFEPFFGNLSALISRKPFAYAITLTVYSILAIPTTAILAVPTVLKVPPIIIAALAAEPFIKMYNKKGSAIAGAIYMFISGWLLAFLFIKMGLPGFEGGIQLAAILILFAMVLGILGSIFGLTVYKRLENYKLIKYIQQDRKNNF